MHVTKLLTGTLSYLVGHVYVVIAPNDKNKHTEYWIARCVEPKKK